MCSTIGDVQGSFTHLLCLCLIKLHHQVEWAAGKWGPTIYDIPFDNNFSSFIINNSSSNGGGSSSQIIYIAAGATLGGIVAIAAAGESWLWYGREEGKQENLRERIQVV